MNNFKFIFKAKLRDANTALTQKFIFVKDEQKIDF